METIEKMRRRGKRQFRKRYPDLSLVGKRNQRSRDFRDGFVLGYVDAVKKEEK